MNQLVAFSLVAIGGGLGAAVRYALSLVLTAGLFPWGTVVSNLAGSFLIGLLAGADTLLPVSPRAKLLVATGFCGGLTTMSSFVFETHHMTRHAEFLLATTYAGLTLLGSFAAFAAGLFLIRTLIRT